MQPYTIGYTSKIYIFWKEIQQICGNIVLIYSKWNAVALLSGDGCSALCICELTTC